MFIETNICIFTGRDYETLSKNYHIIWFESFRKCIAESFTGRNSAGCMVTKLQEEDDATNEQ